MEAAEQLGTLVGLDNIRVTRIQSSHCEAGSYDKILQGLGPELLWSLATGHECVIYDYGSRDRTRGVPRALFLGMQFVRWALRYLWFDVTDDVALIRGKNVVPFWRDEVMPYKIHKRTKKLMRYYAPYARALAVRDVRLVGVYGAVTRLDGCVDEYVAMAGSVWGGSVADNEARFEQWLKTNGLCVYDPNATPELLAQRQLELSALALDSCTSN